jgi:hypothetical protein
MWALTTVGSAGSYSVLSRLVVCSWIMLAQIAEGVIRDFSL